MKKNNFNWKMLLVIAAATVGLGIARDGIPAIAPFLQVEFNLSKTQLGLYTTFLLTSSTIVAIFSGRIIDILGSKRSMTYALTFTAILIALYGFSPTFHIFLILTFLNGFSTSMLSPAASKGVMHHFKEKHRATAMGFVQSGIGVGSFLIAISLPFLSNYISWRIGLIISGTLILFLAFIVKKFYKKREDIPSKNVEKSDIQQQSFKEVLLKLIRNRQLLLLCFIGFVLGSAFSSINTHYSLFLFESFELTNTQVGVSFSLLHFGSIFGRIGWGIISDHLFKSNRRKSLLSLGIFTASMILIFGILGLAFNPSLIFLYILSIPLGFSVMGYFGLYTTTIAETAGEKDLGTAMGLNLIFMRFGFIVYPPLFGYIADHFSTYYPSWLILGSLVLISSIIYYRLAVNSAD